LPIKKEFVHLMVDVKEPASEIPELWPHRKMKAWR